MKQKCLLTSILTLCCSLIFTNKVLAVSNLQQEAGATVEVTVDDTTEPVDPENPGEVVDPGEGPSTKGILRFDYAPSINFGNVKITDKNRSYHAWAQNFHGETGPRGSYVQITDYRSDNSGWTMQVVQEQQFHNNVIQDNDEKELRGAVLSLDKGWANSSGSGTAPIVTSNAIAIDRIGEAYEIATASKGTGTGVWTISFGASEENSNFQDNTLTKLLDENGKEVIDPIYKKPVYSNSAITLTVPDSTKIHPVQYETKLTWILARLP